MPLRDRVRECMKVMQVRATLWDAASAASRSMGAWQLGISSRVVDPEFTTARGGEASPDCSERGTGARIASSRPNMAQVIGRAHGVMSRRINPLR